MSARRGWIGEPQPPREWPQSRHSRMAERIAAVGYEAAKRELHKSIQRAVEKTWAEQEAKNAELRKIDNSQIPRLRLADRYQKRVGDRRVQHPEAE